MFLRVKDTDRFRLRCFNNKRCPRWECTDSNVWAAPHSLYPLTVADPGTAVDACSTYPGPGIAVPAGWVPHPAGQDRWPDCVLSCCSAVEGRKTICPCNGNEGSGVPLEWRNGVLWKRRPIQCLDREGLHQSGDHDALGSCRPHL